MKRIRFFAPIVLAGFSLILSLSTTGAADKDTKEAPVIPPRKGESKTIKLFNGKDLTGWVTEGLQPENWLASGTGELIALLSPHDEHRGQSIHCQRR